MFKMKILHYLIGASYLLLVLSSCIKEEAPNMEADIVKVLIADSLINGAPIINNNNIAIYIKENAVNISEYALHFETTAGATAFPPSGSVQDFTQPVVYTITAQDGIHSKQYLVTIVEESVPSSFSFEHYELDAAKNFTVFFESTNVNKQYIWASGNTGFAALAGANPNPEDYPTQTTKDRTLVQDGNTALRLVTQSTGALGALVNKPIAAGSLYIGSLDVSNQFNPVAKMGLPFNKIPIKLEGYYKYTPGNTLIDKDSNILAHTDECAIYAVLYDRVALHRKSQVHWLSNDNAKTDEHIIAIADLKTTAATNGDGMHKFSIPFEYIRPLDRNAAQAYNYNIAVVFSSSKNGELFEGAVGSELIIDKVTIITE